MVTIAAHTLTARQNLSGGIFGLSSQSDECRCVRHPRMSLRGFWGVSRPLHCGCVCRHHTYPRNNRETLSRDDCIRSNGEVRRDRRHDCVQCRPCGRRPHSRNGNMSHRARQRDCRAIVGTRRGTLPTKKLQAGQPRYNRAAHAGHPVLRKVWFLSVGEGPGLLWYGFVRIRQNHL